MGAQPAYALTIARSPDVSYLMRMRPSPRLLPSFEERKRKKEVNGGKAQSFSPTVCSTYSRLVMAVGAWKRGREGETCRNAGKGESAIIGNQRRK